MLGQPQVLAVVDGHVDDGGAVHGEGAEQGRVEIGRIGWPEPGDPEALGVGDEIRVPELDAEAWPNSFRCFQSMRP